MQFACRKFQNPTQWRLDNALSPSVFKYIVTGTLHGQEVSVLIHRSDEEVVVSISVLNMRYSSKRRLYRLVSGANSKLVEVKAIVEEKMSILQSLK
jgi:hypothetical protein